MELNMAYESPDFYEFGMSPDIDRPSNTSGIQSPFLTNSNVGGGNKVTSTEHLKTALFAGAVLSFIFLISKDAHKAIMRKAHWIPCDFLVLSAFSIQMLNLLNAQNEAFADNANVKLSIKGQTSGLPKSIQWKDFLMIHNSRTLLCVFAAYVMPGTADRGLEHSWVRWLALVITVFHHVTSQFYIVKPHSNFRNVFRLWPRQEGISDPLYYAYATIISLCFVLLILLLACATIAARSIERIVTDKISVVLRGEGEFCASLAEKTQEAHPRHHSCWRTVKSHVNRVDHHNHLHHDHDRSCLRAVEEAVVGARKADENYRHSCWRTVEDAVLRMEKREENHHSCWRTVEDAVDRGEKEEDEHHRRHSHNCWRTVEDTVLKAWIIVRAYSTQPVIARSALTASAAIIVTIQIVITIVGGLAKEMNGHDVVKEKSFKFIATVLQSIFILIAWALINLRWATAVAYHRRRQTDSWLSGLRIEDFWTRHLRELQHKGESRLPQAQWLDTKIESLVSKEKTTRTVPSKLLSAAIGLQWLLVSFSKACWLVSLMIFHNKLMGKMFSFMFEKHIMYEFEDYPKYRKILGDVQMLGESPESLWVANRKAIQKAKSLIIQGNQDGEYNCEDLVEFLINRRTDHGLGLSCLDPFKPQSGLKYLCKKRPIQSTQQPQEKIDVETPQSRGREKQSLAVEEQFTDESTKSWKMTAVSLLGIIVHLSPIYADFDNEHCSTSHTFPPRAVKDCLKAYSQAWEIIDFVEEADTEPDGVTSEAADKYFQALQKKVDKGDFPASSFRHATPECVRAAFEELKEESKSKTEPRGSVNLILRCALALKGKKGKEESRPNGLEGNDSIDWTASASGTAVYNLCSSIECDDGANVRELLKELECSLAYIINECLEKVRTLLLLKSRKWALNRDERRMGKALYAAGKAKVIMEKLVWNKVAIVSYH